MKLSVVSEQKKRFVVVKDDWQKVEFLQQSFQALCLFPACFEGANEMPVSKTRIALEVLHRANLFLSESYWPTSNSGLSLPSAMFIYLFLFFCRVAALCDSQSQASNSNL